MKEREITLHCLCGDKSEHVFHFAQYDLDKDYSDANMGQCTVSTRLNPYLSWYKRVYFGIRYMFGRTDFHYVESVVDVKTLKEVVQLLEDNRSTERQSIDDDETGYDVKEV